jgi:phage terminase large subunit-like protein
MLTDKEAAKLYKLPVRAVELMRSLPRYDPFALAQPDYTVNLEPAEEFIELFNAHIKIPDGDMAGQPFILSWWQEAILLNFYSWLRGDGFRRYREAFIYVGKKNSKTTFTAGWAAIEFRFFCKPGAQFYSIAANRDQAGLVFKQWVGMLKCDDVLAEGIDIFGAGGPGTVKSLVNTNLYASYKPMSREAGTGDGVGPDFLIGDELHRHKDGELMEVMENSTASKRDAIILKTSTADHDRVSICNTTVKLARLVCANDGDPNKPGYNPAILPAIFEVTPQEYQENPLCWQDLAYWKKANPNWDISVHEDFALAKIQKAKDDPSALNNILRLHLNIVTEQSEIWMPMDKYDACEDGRTDAELAMQPCWGGLDLSARLDLTSFCLAWKHPCGGYDLRWWFWLPAEDIHNREKKDAVPYRVWETAGYMELIPGEVIDQEHIKQRILQICKQYRVQTIGADKFNNSWIMQGLMENRVEVVEFPQNAGSITEPAKEVMAKVIEGKFRHNANPIARWNYSNAVIKKFPNDTFRLDKDKAEKRIDGVAASIMAIGCAMKGQEKRSAYAGRGVAYGTG